MRLICPKCGKNTKIFLERFCLDCFREYFLSKSKIPENISIYKCKFCGKYSLTKKYLFNTLDEALNHLVTHSDFSKKIELEKKIELFEQKIILTITKDNIVIIKKEIKIVEKPFTCKFCAMKKSGYKQAILQLRFNVDKSLLNEIENIVDRKNKYDLLSFISKIEKTKYGIDLYLGSKRVAYEILKFLSSKLPIKYKVSKTLVGVKGGKRLYLDTILIKKYE